MDWLLAACGLAGVALGASALVPGLHINSLAAVLLVAGAAHGGSGAAALLVAAAVAHTFFAILPGTYLGIPADDTAIAVLPAQRMARDGRGSEAVRVARDATLLATLAAVLLALPAKWLLEEPGRVAAGLEAILPWLLLAILAILAVAERRKSWGHVAWALLVQAMAGFVGWAAQHTTSNGWVPVPGAILMPLFGGLFGAAGLLAALLGEARLPWQAPAAPATARQRRALAAATWRGTLAAFVTVGVPGLTPGVGASLAYRQGGDDLRPPIAALNATGAAHQLLAIVVLFVTLRARTGLAAGLGAILPLAAWEAGRPPPELVDMLTVSVGAAMMSWGLVAPLDRLARMAAWRIPGRFLALAGLASISGLSLVLAGPAGLAVLAAAATVGLVPLAVGARRVHLVACAALPLALARLALRA